MQKLALRAWAVSDRPREKLLDRGRRALTNAELLAILIGTGSQEETAVELARRILSDMDNDLGKLSKLEVAELRHYKGIGQAKAISIVSALEFGRRRQALQIVDKPILNNSQLVFDYFKAQLQDLSHEEFWVVFLNTACRLVGTQIIGRGGSDFSPVDVRGIMRYTLQNKASSIILMHNHPSGSLVASFQDKHITQKIIEAAKVLDIKVQDHLIFSDKSYLSFLDEGLLEI